MAKIYLGHEEDINPLGLEPRDTRGWHRGARPLFLPVAQEQSL